MHLVDSPVAGVVCVQIREQYTSQFPEFASPASTDTRLTYIIARTKIYTLNEIEVVEWSEAKKRVPSVGGCAIVTSCAGRACVRADRPRVLETLPACMRTGPPYPLGTARSRTVGPWDPNRIYSNSIRPTTNLDYFIGSYNIIVIISIRSSTYVPILTKCDNGRSRSPTFITHHSALFIAWQFNGIHRKIPK